MHHVPGVARDDVDVQVKDGLARRGANVDADVVTIRAVPLVDGSSGDVDRTHQLDSLLRGRGEPVGHVSTRDEQSMPFAHRKRVPQADNVLARIEQPIRGQAAEGAVDAAHAVPLATAC